MASTYSTNLRLELMAAGENSNTWGAKANTNLNMVEQAVSGVASVAMTDADYTLTTSNAATDEARNMVITMTGTLTQARNVIVPSTDKVYVFKNSTTGGFAVTIKTSGGTGVAVPNGATMQLYCNATNVEVSATTVGKIAFTQPATGATVTIAEGKTLTVSKTLTLTGTDGVTITFPTTSATMARTDAAQTFAAAQSISISSASTALSINQTGSGNAILIEDSTAVDASPFLIDSAGKLCSGYTAPIVIGGASYRAEVLATGSDYPMAVGYSSASATGPTLSIVKNRAADWGTNTVVQSNDVLGEISFKGADGGTSHVTGARIIATVGTGTPGPTSMPGVLSFQVTPDGAASSVELFKLISTGHLIIAQGLTNAVNDAAAAAGGVPVNGMYRNGSVMMIRVA